jgi:hypothetical protein
VRLRGPCTELPGTTERFASGVQVARGRAPCRMPAVNAGLDPVQGRARPITRELARLHARSASPCARSSGARARSRSSIRSWCSPGPRRQSSGCSRTSNATRPPTTRHPVREVASRELPPELVDTGGLSRAGTELLQQASASPSHHDAPACRGILRRAALVRPTGGRMVDAPRQLSVPWTAWTASVISSAPVEGARGQGTEARGVP